MARGICSALSEHRSLCDRASGSERVKHMHSNLEVVTNYLHFSSSAKILTCGRESTARDSHDMHVSCLSLIKICAISQSAHPLLFDIKFGERWNAAVRHAVRQPLNESRANALDGGASVLANRFSTERTIVSIHGPV
jgi:hypothetical protein